MNLYLDMLYFEGQTIGQIPSNKLRTAFSWQQALQSENKHQRLTEGQRQVETFFETWRCCG